jgi:hypothetical protein
VSSPIVITDFCEYHRRVVMHDLTPYLQPNLRIKRRRFQVVPFFDMARGTGIQLQKSPSKQQKI